MRLFGPTTFSLLTLCADGCCLSSSKRSSSDADTLTTSSIWPTWAASWPILLSSSRRTALRLSCSSLGGAK
jgi:hypothetical protein